MDDANSSVYVDRVDMLLTDDEEIKDERFK